MTQGVDIAQFGVAQMSAAFRERVLSPVTVIDAYADRIAEQNPALNAFLELRIDAARAEAEAADARWRAGAPRSLIDGVPFGVKANIAVAGMACHGGIAAYSDNVAMHDAPCVAILRAAGATPIGTLNMHEGALGATTDNPHFGRCVNPWADGMTPGGSSGGSGAAAAAGLCAFALGTDTMGSVRIPSAYCGVAGVKPSAGVIPAGGMIDLSPTLDHIGLHARQAGDLATALSCYRALAPAPEQLRIGVAAWGDAVDVDAPVAAAFDAAIACADAFGALRRIDLSDIAFGALRRCGLLVSEVEGYRFHKARLGEAPDGFSDAFRALLEWGARQPADKIDTAYDRLRAAGDAFNARFDGVDVIMAPTTPQLPFSFDDDPPANQADFTCIANFAGAPAVATPAAPTGAPPASVQFIARRGDDHLALAAAAAFEAARGPAPRPPGAE